MSAGVSQNSGGGLLIIDETSERELTQEMFLEPDLQTVKIRRARQKTDQRFEDYPVYSKAVVNSVPRKFKNRNFSVNFHQFVPRKT